VGGSQADASPLPNEYWQRVEQRSSQAHIAGIIISTSLLIEEKLRRGHPVCMVGEQTELFVMAYIVLRDYPP
jgi:hypothetical protein